MIEKELHYTKMPYFAEVPYWIWGEVNYDSEGDCKTPTDNQWTLLLLQNRESKASVRIERVGNIVRIISEDENIEKSILRLIMYTNSEEIEQLQYKENILRTNRIREEFINSKLKPFDNHYFWGSWKWVGWYATDFTWVGRWIINSILYPDSRAIHLCATWLLDRELPQEQESALLYAINYLTGKKLSNFKEFKNWWNGNILLIKLPAKIIYLEPDIDEWYKELKEFGDKYGKF